MINFDNSVHKFYRDGWLCFDTDPKLQGWVAHALPHAIAAMHSPQHSKWWRYGNTWFVGVNALPNDDAGRLADGPPLNGTARKFINQHIPFCGYAWDRAQVSVCMPGYPKQDDNEPSNAHRYRINRDAAHIDGLRKVEPQRKRFLDEYHGFIFGLPMVKFSHGASPFVVWQGSHTIAYQAFNEFYKRHPVASWCSIDATDMYQTVRRQIFKQCQRVEISLLPAQAFVVHRFALHGMAAWAAGATATATGRMICYFRPEIDDPFNWLTAP